MSGGIVVGKLIGGLIKLITFSLLFWLLSYLIYSMGYDFLDDYNLFDTEDTPAIVTEKLSVNSMTGLPKYYVIVNLNEEEGYNGIKNKVFSWQFKRLEVGDTIRGHHVHGGHFFTTYDIVRDGFWFILVMLLLFFFMMALMMWPIIGFVEKREKQNKSPLFSNKKKKREKKRKNVIKPFLKRILPEKIYQFIEELLFQKLILITVLPISLILAGGFLMNGLYKVSPLGKTSTTAFVVDSSAEGEIYYYVGEYSDPYYTLDLIFTDKNDQEYRVIKEVTRSIYQKYGDGGPIEISYSIFNPNHIFVRDYSILSILEIGGYAKFWLYLTIVAGVAIFLFFYFSKVGKKK